MEIIMRCPKCQKEMETGYLGSSEKGMLIWAEKKYFDNKLCNFFTKRDALKHGAINIRVGNGVTNDRTIAWACRECKFVLVDCN
jgi:hypothetical protein